MGTLVAVLERYVPILECPPIQTASSLGWSVIIAFSLWSWKVDDFTNITTFLPQRLSGPSPPLPGPGWWPSLLFQALAVGERFRCTYFISGIDVGEDLGHT